jgi:hypothetical protein
MPNPRKSLNVEECAPLTKQDPGKATVMNTMATHQVTARQGKTKQSSARTEAVPQQPKTKSHPNVPGKLVSHRILAMESHQRAKAPINISPSSH